MMTRTSIAFILVTSMAAGALAQTPRAPLPLDPLTPAEVERAEQIATGNPRVREVAGPNLRPVVTSFIAPKRGAQSEPDGRFAEVVVHNETEGGGARVLVDLGAGAVVDVVRLTERYVPIGPNDIERAASLALESPAVHRLLGGAETARTFRVARGAATRATREENRIEGVPTRSPDPDDPCSRNRCVTLFFRSRNRYIAMNRVTVDLTARRVYVREGGRP